MNISIMAGRKEDTKKHQLKIEQYKKETRAKKKKISQERNSKCVLHQDQIFFY